MSKSKNKEQKNSEIFNFINNIFNSINNIGKMHTHMDTNITKLEDNNIEIFILLIVIIVIIIFMYNNNKKQ